MLSAASATLGLMLTGRLLTESLRVGADLSIPDLRVIRLGRTTFRLQRRQKTPPSTSMATSRAVPPTPNRRFGPSSTSKLQTNEPKSLPKL
jgi:hypothetical protein